MKIGLIGGPFLRGNFAQRIPFEELPDDEFPCGPVVVKTPEVERLERKIGDDHMVGISGHLEKRELPRGFFGNEAPDDNEALCSLPAHRFVFELCQPGLRKNFLVGKRAEVSPNGFGNPGDNGVGTGDFLDIFGDAVVVEGGIGSHSDISNTRGQFGEALLQKRDGVGYRMCIAREIRPLPDIAGFAFEAKERLIRRAASLFGVESYAGSLLLTIDGDHVGIQVEDHGEKGFGLHEELSSESVVERLKGSQSV